MWLDVKELNASARPLFSLWKHNHMTPVLQELHWLKIEQWIDYKLTVLVQYLASPYLASSLQRVLDIGTRWRHHKPSLSRQHDSTLLTTALSTWPGHGTVCQALSHWCLYYSLQEALFDHQFFLHHRFVFLFSIFCFVRCRSSSLLTLYHHNRIRSLKSRCR